LKVKEAQRDNRNRDWKLIDSIASRSKVSVTLPQLWQQR
jgi:hypothetical protein